MKWFNTITGKDLLIKAGLFGELTLLATNGHYFSGGTYLPHFSSHLYYHLQIKFRTTIGEEITAPSFPYKQFIFLPSEIQTPIVEFEYDKNWLNKYRYTNGLFGDSLFTEAYLPYLKKSGYYGYLNDVRIKISKEIMAQENCIASAGALLEQEIIKYRRTYHPEGFVPVDR